MSENASISAGIAARYATAMFELAKEDKALGALESDINALAGAVGESEDFRKLISSPVYTRDETKAAITAVAKKMGLSGNLTNLLGLMAENRRLFVMPQLVAALRDLIAEEKGEITAEVTSAKALTAAQSKALAKTLKDKVGKDVNIQATVDETLIGGLVVKVGSKMIDTSIRSKLANLQNSMKEVG